MWSFDLVWHMISSAQHVRGGVWDWIMHGDLAVDQRQAERRKIGESLAHWVCQGVSENRIPRNPMVYYHLRIFCTVGNSQLVHRVPDRGSRFLDLGAGRPYLHSWQRRGRQCLCSGRACVGHRFHAWSGHKQKWLAMVGGSKLLPQGVMGQQFWVALKMYQTLYGCFNHLPSNRHIVIPYFYMFVISIVGESPALKSGKGML